MVAVYMVGESSGGEREGVDESEEVWCGLKAYKQTIVPSQERRLDERVDRIGMCSEGGNSMIWGSEFGGGAYGIGPNLGKQLGLGKNGIALRWTEIPLKKAVKQASVGSHHSLLLTTDGMVYSCGRGDGGQLGLGPKTKSVYNFTSISSVSSVEYIGTASSARRFENQSASYLLLSNGKIMAFGNNNYQKLGLGQAAPHNVWLPTECGRPHEADGTLLEDVHYTQIAVGKHHVLALDADGKVYAWGCGDLGRLGLDDLKHRGVPTLIPSLAKLDLKFDSVIARETFSLAHSAAGNRAYSWGFGTRGQIGRGEKEGLRATPAKPGAICWGREVFTTKLIANDDLVIALTSNTANGLVQHCSHLAWGKFDLSAFQFSSLQPEVAVHFSPQARVLAFQLFSSHAFIVTENELPQSLSTTEAAAADAKNQASPSGQQPPPKKQRQANPQDAHNDSPMDIEDAQQGSTTNVLVPPPTSTALPPPSAPAP